MSVTGAAQSQPTPPQKRLIISPDSLRSSISCFANPLPVAAKQRQDQTKARRTKSFQEGSLLGCQTGRRSSGPGGVFSRRLQHAFHRSRGLDGMNGGAQKAPTRVSSISGLGWNEWRGPKGLSVFSSRREKNRKMAKKSLFFFLQFFFYFFSSVFLAWNVFVKKIPRKIK